MRDVVIITRKEAKERGLKRYFTGKPCKHGHVSERYVGAGHCIQCTLTSDTVKAGKAEWRRKNRDKLRYRSRFYTMKCRYGIGKTQWDEIFDAQGQKCAICKVDESRLVDRWNVDHCHTTNKLRGILCRNCNTALGLFGDSIENLLAAADYVRKNQ